MGPENSESSLTLANAQKETQSDGMPEKSLELAGFSQGLSEKRGFLSGFEGNYIMQSLVSAQIAGRPILAAAAL